MGFFKDFGNALIGAGSSLVGNIFGAFSQKSANKANKEINQMNNEFNERMMQKQMDYNTMMWNKQNDYNSPLAQRQRLEAAGMNPYIMMNGGSAGNAQSAGSTSMASAAGAAPQQAFQPNFQGIPEAILMAKQGKNIDADTQSKVIDNQTRARKNMQEIANMVTKGMNDKVTGKLLATQYNYADEMHMLQLQNQRQSLRNLTIEGLMMDKTLSAFDSRLQLELSQAAANILLTNAQVGKTHAETKREIEQTIKIIAETAGIKMNNNNLAAMSNSIIETAKANSVRAGQPQNIWQGFSDFMHGFNNFAEDYIVKPSKKAWKDTKRSLGL